MAWPKKTVPAGTEGAHTRWLGPIHTRWWPSAAVLIVGGLMAAVYLFNPLAWTFAGSDTPVVEATAPLRTAAPLALALLAVSLGFAGQAMVDVAASATSARLPAAVAVDVR